MTVDCPLCHYIELMDSNIDSEMSDPTKSERPDWEDFCNDCQDWLRSEVI